MPAKSRRCWRGCSCRRSREGVIQRRRRCPSLKRFAVVSDIGPDVPFDRLALRQDRHRGVVAMQTFGRQNVGLDQRMQRLQRAAVQAPTWSASVDTLRSMPSRRYRSLCRFSGWCWPNFSNRIIASRFGPGEATRRHMERRWRLRDRLTPPARELLAHRLDHLPGSGR